MQTIRRAIVIGNGFAGAENQCIGLLRALGFSDNYTLYRVSRPRGGINERLHWLPVSAHKQLERAINWIGLKPYEAKKLVPLPAEGRGDLCFLANNFRLCFRGRCTTYCESGPRHIWQAFRIAIYGYTLIYSLIGMLACRVSRLFWDGPILVVASGRDTIAVASSINRLVPENVFLVQIQHPRSRLHRFDLVITPHHDYYPLLTEAQQQIPFFLRRWATPRKPPDEHVVLTVGALHQADSAALRSAASAWHDEMAILPKPLLVVSIGGPTRHCRYGADLAMQLTTSLKSVFPTCGSVRVSFSRRTPKTVSDIVMRELSNHHNVYIWNGEDPNPHLGHLAWADAFVITADSVSMLSEACSTGKPVYVIGAERCTWKFSYFLKSLQHRGAVRPFTGAENISEKWQYPPLCDTEKAADEVIKAVAKRGWRFLPK